MDKRSVSIVKSGPTGPRTPAGKARSKFNAMKHGILSASVVVGIESREDFCRFVSEFVDVWQPVGRHEETLVELIAATFWRRRRLFEAETASIDLAELRAHRSLADEARDRYLASLANMGLEDMGAYKRSRWTDDTEGMVRVLDQLRDLKRRILRDGLDWDRDRAELEELFGKQSMPNEKDQGDTSNASGANFPSLPELYWRTIHRELDPDEKNGQHNKRVFIGEAIDTYVRIMEPQIQECQERDRQLENLRASRNLVPSEKDCELLMRYEAHLDRVIDRAINQLERLQRMRRGQPVPPPIKVEVTK